jgi:hypothetical protein
MTKPTMASTCSIVIGHFNGHGSLPVQYEAHVPIHHIQGYSGSHWMLTLGNYLLCIAPAAARATGTQKTTNKYTYKACHFDGHAMCLYVSAHISQWRRSRALLEATGHRHWASIMSDNIKGTWLRRFFYVFHPQNRRKSSRVDDKTPVFNRGMMYQTKEKDLTKVSI